MRFRILGPPELRLGGRTVPVGRSRPGRILITLLLDANRVVAVDRLVAVVWDGDPPRTARKLVQNSVSEVRQQLAGAAELDTTTAGYLLRVPDGQLDLDVFVQSTARARRLAGAGDVAGAGAEMRAALALWRGPALAGMTGRILESRAAALDDARLGALEDCLDHELALGHHDGVISELVAAVAEHPLRERLVGLLMLALHRSGRRSAALDAFQAARARLADELGIDPGIELDRLHAAILRADPGLAPAPPAAPASTAAPPELVPVPAQLPADLAGFIGRDAELDRLDQLAAAGTLVVTAIGGTAGVGKTALAVRWAHRARHRYPDGQLYVNLRGHAAAGPVPPAEALAGFLSALGVPRNQLPTTVEAAAARYRTLLADRRMLVLLDNARDVQQVRPLLPGGAHCVVVVTSRAVLGGLVVRDGARRIDVGLLTPHEAYTLLAEVLDAGRAAAEPDAVAELARLCGYLPLALRIAGAHLHGRPDVRVADLVAELSAGDRLARLAVDGDDESAVRPAFDLSYAALDPADRRLFRLLGLAPLATFTAELAAALSGDPVAATTAALDRLRAAYLVDLDSHGRYAFHDLIRLYAAERATTEEAAADRAAATHRLFDWYLSAVDAASEHPDPHVTKLPMRPVVAPVRFDDAADAGAWLDAEWSNLLSTVEHAVTHGPQSYAWLVADRLNGYCLARQRSAGWLVLTSAALIAAEAAGDYAARAWTHNGVGNAYAAQGDYERAGAHYRQGVDLARNGGWPEGELRLRTNLGRIGAWAGAHREALPHYRRALDLARLAGSPRDAATIHVDLAILLYELGELRSAISHGEQALAGFRAIGSEYGVAVSRANLAEALLADGRVDDAIEHLTATTLNRDSLGYRLEAERLRLLACAYRDVGRHSDAHRQARTALDLAHEVQDRRVEAAALDTLASVHLGTGDHQLALRYQRRAHDLAREQRDRHRELTSLVGLAWATLAVDAAGEAMALAGRAAEDAGRAGYRLVEGQARTALAAARLAMDEPKHAVEQAERAITTQESIGHRTGAARSWRILADALARADQADAAHAAGERATALTVELGLL